MIIRWIFLVLVLWTVPSTGLICYSCWCPSSNISACDYTVTVNVDQGSHCTIVEDLHTTEPYLELSFALLNSSYVYIKDPYYILVDEAIFYNETTTDWITRSKRIVYGCDWDFCNQYSLISSLPDTFQLSIDKTWLTENIYGTGTVTGCHTCSNAVCSNETTSINYDLCPFLPCGNNSTTCALYDLWHNVEADELCYHSQCALPQIEDEFSEINSAKYKLQIEAIVYLAQNRSNIDIWQLDINCGVDNCSRPTIFQEIKERLSGNTGDLTDFPIGRPTTTTAPPPTTTLPIRPLSCYNCSCVGTTCPCTTYEIISAVNTHCTIIRQSFAQDVSIYYGHIAPGSTHFYIREYPYILLEESIIYNELSGRWTTIPEIVVYGCNWDLCNKPELLPYLPSSFRMRLPELWLNSSVLGTGQPVRDCHECPDEPVCSNTDFIDGAQCPVESCNTTCLISDLFDDPTTTHQCYQSFCAPPDFENYPIDTHRVQIEGILYASRPDTIELWEIDIYCRADNCSRPEIFKELREQLTLDKGDVSIIFNQTAPESTPIRCYNCYCKGEENCICDTISSMDAKSTYCTIVRNDDGENVYVYFDHLEIGTSYSNVREFPYVIVEESIFYDNETGKWNTRTNAVTYGCNWDYCNKPSLLPLLPTSFRMRLPEAWLNESILGTGQPVHDCHECPGDAICSLTNSTNGNLCPIESCNTTCFVSNTYSNPANNEQCYQSYCIPEESNEFKYDTHLIRIEGIVYPSQLNKVELWEVSVYCRADNCSRPEIFKEIENQLIVEPGNLSLLFDQTSISEPDQLRCYACYCYNDPICACNNTMVMFANSTYCTIIRLYDGQDIVLILEHIDKNSSYIYINEFPNMLVEESITYDGSTGRWITRPSLIVYGCNTDFCNDPRLIPRLPLSFQMRLPESWLNSSVLGTGQPVRDCHECPDAPQCGTTDFLDDSRCPIQSCNTTCFVSDTFDDPTTDLLCYHSYCLEPEEDYEENRHRVEIEGIIYGNRPDAQLELWEIDIYCRADDCSRADVFKELQAQLQVDTGDLSAFFNITTTSTTTTTPPIEPRLSCYECSCYNDPNCTCSTVAVAGAYTSYCTIVRIVYDNGDFTIDLEHIDRNSTRVYIRKFPYLLAEESILYNETTKKWSTKTNILVYGCNWHLCNHPSLVTLLPDSFKMTLSDEWLNTNVIGTGQPLRDCHECPDSPQCGTTDFLDDSRCPIRSCNTTCLVSDTFNDPTSDLLCYQSYCLAPIDDFEENRHRVELEGIIYGDQQDVVELWEIDIYCRADDCSRKEIFDELRKNLTVQTGNLSVIFDNSSRPIIEPQLICYNCFCFNEPDCVCQTYTSADAKSTYCIIIRQNFGNDFAVNLQHIDRNSTRVFIREFPYLLVEESIIYDENTGRWNTRSNVVIYGCKTDYCNHPLYIPYLPDSFEMRMSETWLNANVLGTGEPVRNCHQCPIAPVCSTTDFVDGALCPIQPCNTTCLVSDIYDDPSSNLQCYQSFCAPPDSEIFTIDPHRVDMEGILYLNPIGRPVELWEIDIYCRADDCSRPEVFNEIREQFLVTIPDINIFYNTTITLEPSATTTVPSTTSPSGITTVPTGSTTTSTVRTTNPPGSTTTATGSTTNPPGSTTNPPGSTTNPPGSTTNPPGSTTNPAGSTTTSTGSTMIPSGTTTTTRAPIVTTTTITAGSSASTCMAHIMLTLFFLLISMVNLY